MRPHARTQTAAPQRRPLVAIAALAALIVSISSAPWLTSVAAQTPSPNSLDVTVSGVAIDGDTDGMIEAGETIDYTYVIANNGPTTITDIAIDDPGVSNESCPATVLTTGTSMTCTGSYLLAQTDIDGGEVVDQISATGTDSDGSISSGTGTTTTAISANSDVQMTKSGAPNDANADGTMSVGETIDYTITVTNVGNTTVSGLAVSDPTAGNPTCDVTQLAPVAVATCTVSYPLTQADIDASSVDNTAIVTGTDPSGATVTDAATATTRINVNPSLQVTKTTASTGKAIGDVVDYTITVENDGNLALTNVTLNDPMTANETCPATDLAVGASMTCTASVTISQADIDAGAIDNTATATGTESGGTQVQASGSNNYPLTSVASISAQKTGQIVDDDGDGVIKPGETINYTILVTNDGDLTVNNLSVADPIAGPPYCDKRILAPGETATCTVTDHVRSGDPDAGFAYNAVTATADASNGTTVSATAEVSLPIESVPSLLVVKTNDMDTLVEGEVVHYNIVVNNTGNTTISNITIQDDLTADETCPQTSLSAGNNMLCTASYTITADDMAAGQVENLVIVRGQDVAATLVEQSATTVSPYTPDPQYVIVTRGYARDLDADGMLEPGDTVFYTVWLSNVGNILFDPVWVTDAKTGDPTCDKTAVAPGQTTGCTIDYALTQADVDAGFVQNQAVGHMTLSDGTELTATASDTTTLTAVPLLDVTITPPATTPGVDDTTQYSISVTNSGNVTIDSVTVTDSLAPDVQCPTTTLVSGETMVCTATYTVTQADVDVGSFATTVTASGVDPNATSVTKTKSQTFTVSQTPKLTVLKKGTAQDANGDGVFVAGDQVDYTITVTNSGDVTLGQLAVADAKTGPPTCNVTSLAPGAVTTCTASYTVTQSEVDAGSVINTATASAKTQSGQTVSAQDTEATSLRANPSLAVAKTAANGPLAVGESISYSIEVTNTGNVRLSALTLTDPMTTDETCSSTIVEVGQSVACTATHVVTQGDVDAGSVDNTVQAETVTPLGNVVQASGSHSYPLPQASGVLIDLKATIVDADLDGIVDAGETIDYVATVTNTGTVTLSSVAVTDAASGPMTCDVTTLAPGAQAVCTSSYPITQADIDSSQVATTATVSALTPASTSVTDSATVTTALASVSRLEVAKSAPVGDLVVGQTIDYVIDVTNAGNRDLVELTISDPLTTDEVCPQTVLAPGASMTCSASYLITQGDVDTGSVENTVTVSGRDPSAVVVTGQGSHAYPFAQTTGLSVQRSGTVVEVTGDAMIGAGDAIDYVIEVRNAGNVTLSSLSAVDDTAPEPVCDQQSLAPGQTATCTSRYVLTQADVDAGQVTGSATASALNPGGESVVGSASSSEDIVGVATLVVDKSAPGAEIAAGETIAYSIVVTNSGTLTLNSVGIDDVLTSDETCPQSTIAPGDAMTCSASYVATQQDVDAGMVQNTVDVTATDPSATTVSASASHSYPLVQSAVLDVVENGSVTDTDVDGRIEAGETVQYVLTLTNNGTVTLSAIAIDAAAYTSASCPTTTLAPGESIACEAANVLTQADIDGGEVTDTATVTALDPSGVEVVASAQTVVVIPTRPALVVTKSADGTELAVGATINYAISVTNSGNVTLSAIAIEDPLTPDEACPQDQLAPGSEMLCSASHLITQADVDSGGIENTVTVTASPPSKPALSSSDSHSYPLMQAPRLDVVQTATAVDADADGQLEAAETVAYAVTVTNGGNVTIHDLTLVDTGFVSMACPDTALAPGASTTCDVVYALTQNDIDAGLVAHTIEARALDVNNAAVTGSDPEAVPVSIPASPSVSLTKSADPGPLAVGDTIAYSITITNTGNVGLDQIAIADTLTPDEACPSLVLGVGEAMTCTATHVITQPDVDAGIVDNTVELTATAADGTELTEVASHAFPVPQNPALGAEMTATVQDPNSDGMVMAGESVLFEYTVTNSGDVQLVGLGGVLVPDSSGGLGTVDPTAPDAVAMTCAADTLAPLEATTCTATVMLKQADVDGATLIGAYEITASHDQGVATVASDLSVPLEPAPALTVTKSQAQGTVSPGNTVHFDIAVANTGNVTIANIGVTDSIAASVDCSGTQLAPFETLSCTADYTVTLADRDAATIVNTATANGETPTGGLVTAEATSSSSVSDDRHVTSVVAPAGSPATVDVVSDNPVEIDVDTIRLVDPATGDPASEVVISGEGTWLVSAGTLVFTPEEGYTGGSRIAYAAAALNGALVEGVAIVSFDVSVTPTPSPTAPATATALPTATAVPTVTTTATPQPTASVTATPTAGPTDLPSPTPTAQATVAPTASATPTPSATQTPMPRPTAVPTASTTPTSTPGPTSTAVATVAPTMTATPWPTPTGTAVPTATAWPTETPTPSATQTPTSWPTPTPTADATAPPTPGAVATLTPEPTVTASAIPSPPATAPPVVQPTQTVPPGVQGTSTPTPDQPSLAFTGRGIVPVGFTGLGFILVGVTLTALGRRRR